MSKSRMGAPKRAAAGLLVGALSVAGLAFTAAPAGAVANVTAQRIEGATRFATAANVCDQVAPTGAANVILATGRLSFADALTGSALAGDRNTCILLTEQDALPADTSAQLTQMKALGTPLTSVTILGGTVAVSDAVASQVTALGGLTVNRIEGADRYATAAAIATAVGTPGAIGGAGTVIIANGENRLNGADAMAVGPVAARGDGTNPFPILLVQQNEVPASTLTALGAAGIDNLIALGGTDAISASTLTAAATAVGDATPTRVEGPTREDTSVAIAGLALSQGLAVTEVFLANGRIGTFSADALVAGPLGDVRGAATLLTSGVNTLGTAASTYLDANSQRITTVTAIGGTDVISAAVLTAAETAAETVANDTNQTLAVTPNTAASLTRVANPDTNVADDRQYTVSGLTAGTQYVVALFSAADVQVAAGGVATFTDANSNNQADRTVPTADITVVNGASQAVNTSLVTVAPVSGTITFTVDGDGANETVVPVIWVDTTGLTASVLDLTVPAAANANPKTPREVFGVGGATTYAPPAGTVGVIGGPGDVAISGVDKTANTITTATALYTYDENDTFYLRTTDSGDGTDDAGTLAEQVTFATFEAAVSAGDELDGATFYQPTAALPSSFVLENISPAAPGAAIASTTATTATFTVTGLVQGATAEVLCGPDDNGAFNPATDTARGSSATDQSSTVGGFQVIANGLTASTNYDCYVRQISGGETSGVSAIQNVATPAVTETTAPTITDAWVSTDGPVVGILISADGTSGDTIDLAFSEDMIDTLGSSNATFLRISDGTNTFQVDCTAGCTLDDNETKLGANTNTVVDDHLRINLALATKTRIAGTGALDLASGTITITLVSGAFDDQAGNQLNLEGSADRVIDNEPIV